MIESPMDRAMGYSSTCMPKALRMRLKTVGKRDAYLYRITLNPLVSIIIK
jgi:hypothetical protein